MCIAMNFGIQNHDDFLLDRLVDGELSADERRRLIASIDAQTDGWQADGWRRCALAFLEAQSLRSAMRQIVRPQENAQQAFRTVEGASAATAAPMGRRRLASRAGALLATAAAVLVAFSLGWRMNGRPDVGEAELLVGSGTPSAAREGVVPPEAAAARLPDADAITLVVHDASGRPQRMQVPLVEGSRLGEQFGASPQWAAPEIRRQLAEQGIDLKARRRYAPLYFEQQNGVVPMVVPVDDAVITPVSSAVY
jgi:anti-sigma-K factor RskA